MIQIKSKPIIIEVSIIGAGPAGISAAVQLSRSEISVSIIAKEIGGLVKNANLIDKRYIPYVVIKAPSPYCITPAGI